MNLKSRIEAVLFLTDKPIAALAIAQLVNADVQEVRQAVLELIHDYEQRDSALEIADDGGYMMQVKDEYATFANDMAPIELPTALVRTLSAIAIKQPVLQSEIVRIRGAGAYDHIKELLEKELITKKEEGRSALLSTTKKFQEYFRLSNDARALREQLKGQIKIEDKLETEAQITAEETLVANEATAAESTLVLNELRETAIAATESDDTAETAEAVIEITKTVEYETAETKIVETEELEFSVETTTPGLPETEHTVPDNEGDAPNPGKIELASSNI